MNLQRLDHLLRQLDRQEISAAEERELADWYRSSSGEEGFTHSLTDQQRQRLEQWMWDGILQTIAESAHDHQAKGLPDTSLQPQGRRTSIFIRMSALARWSAAALVLAFLAGGYIHLRKHPTTPEAVSPATAGRPAHDALPGGNHATLALADGTVIALDSAQDGMLGHSSGVAIYKQAAGQLVYRAGSNGDSSGSTIPPAACFNVLSTPKGGQYRIILPDGTAVWVNAASTFRYPDHFSGTDRRVELDGEAYFEVAKDPDRPFIVRSRDMNIRVLGTHFDVMNYKDDPNHATTLLEGAVMVTNGQRQALLKPGQQAKIGAVDGQLKVLSADVEAAIAWKNGLFQFEDADLPSILAQVARWYDITVVYAGPRPTDLYRGKISRYVSLSKLLKILELNGVHFTITGKTLTVIT